MAGPDWAVAALARLDATRERAFARRDGAALHGIYASAELAATDLALLRRVVPAGCGLRGVRTQYRAESVVAASHGVVLVVSATLAPSQLVCGGQVRATLPGAGPTRLRIAVVRTRDGPRIARQEVVG